jgi:perosamine synthetase
MRSQGRAADGSWLYHERLGYNYRMSELNAALGVAQMRKLPQILAMRQQVAEMYNQRLRDIPGVMVPYQSSNVKISWFVYVIRLEESIDRGRVIHYLEEAGIGSKPYFPTIHLQPFYIEQFGYRKGDFPIAERIAEQTLAIPFYTELTESEIDYVGTKLQEAIEKAQ